MKKLLLAALLPWLCLLTLTACHKDDPAPTPPPPPTDYTALPPATQTGANTFGCKVNGQVWVPRVPLFSLDVPLVAYLSESNNSGAGRITCNLIDGTTQQYEWMSMNFIADQFSVGEYCCTQNPVVRTSYLSSNDNWYLSYCQQERNCINITRIDTINNVISGTFEFTVYRDTTNQSDKITISEGRFDLKYFPE